MASSRQTMRSLLTQARKDGTRLGITGRKRAVLYIDTWSSECGNCGKHCNPDSKTHDVVLGYGKENGEPGCGIRWRYVSSNYSGEMVEKWCKDMRPDLEYLGFYMTPHKRGF